MTKDEQTKLLDRAAKEAGFRKNLLADPKGTALTMGITLSKDDAQNIAKMAQGHGQKAKQNLEFIEQPVPLATASSGSGGKGTGKPDDDFGSNS